MNGTFGAPFTAGQPVVLGAGPAHARRWYRTSVHRVDDRAIWLHGAPFEQPPVEVVPGEDVTCHTWRHMDAAYQVQARVAFTGGDPEPVVGLTIGGTERIQQRAYVRVPLFTEAWGLYLGSEDRPAILDDAADQPVRLEVRDLSAGGLRGRSDVPLAPGDELEIELALPRAEKEIVAAIRLNGTVAAQPDLPELLSLRARVVRLIETRLSETLACEIGVTFLDVPREAQERIIRFALEVQRTRRRRGLL
jgi:c-di-GMP-binding flagellar brake protein YcgR